MNLHLLGIESLEPAKDDIDVLLGGPRQMHGLSSHCICEPPQRVMPPQRRIPPLQIQLRVGSIALRQLKCLIENIVES